MRHSNAEILVMLRLPAAALLMFLLWGCKLTIMVPDGGSVSSDGGIVCAPGETCEIEITTNDFEQTFSANPTTGYEFVSWVKKSGFFCGRSELPCTVSTLAFAGNPTLEAFLDDDFKFFLAPQFARIAGLETPALRSGFGPSTEVVDAEVGGLTGDIVGADAMIPSANHWVDDLEGGNPFNEFRLYFEGGTPAQRHAITMEDPYGSGDWMLRFRIDEPNVVIEDQDGISCNNFSHFENGLPVAEERKSRIQAVLRDTPGLRQIDYSIRIRLGPAFAALSVSTFPVRWMTMGEIWNDLPEPLSTPNPKYGFRISLVAWKDDAEANKPFHWYVHAQRQNEFIEGTWDNVWTSTDDDGYRRSLVEIPTDGSWVTLRVTAIEGNATTGRMIVTATDETGWTQTIVDRPGWTRHPNQNAPVDGFEAVNPMKLYTNDDIVCGLKQQANLPLYVDWDDFVVGGSVAP